jgi:hypothetical protein
MLGPTDQMKDHLRKVKYQIKVVHKEMNVVIGLHSLLHLQYIHEGHIDESVFDVLDMKIHGIESDLDSMVGSLNVEDLPF